MTLHQIGLPPFRPIQDFRSHPCFIGKVRPSQIVVSIKPAIKEAV